MNVFAHFDTVVKATVEALMADGALPQGLDVTRIVVEPPRDHTHGDVSTNAAMVLARPAGQRPRDLAEMIAARLGDDRDVASAEVAGPGFINLRLEPHVWPRVIATVLDEGERYGTTDLGGGMPVNVEYVSTNPTGPLHVGHCRGAVFGDALANLLAATGYRVTREYYVNDAGVQIDVLARSVHLRYREALGEAIGAVPSGLYPGDYLKPVGRKLADIHGRTLLEVPEEEWLPIVRAFAIDEIMAMIRGDLAALGIRHDVFFSEHSLHEGADSEIARTVAELRERDLVYEGRLPPPKGQVPEDWEDREQTLFRATQFGDDIDRPLMKSDGSYTYFAADVAYFHSKFARGFKQMIYVLGADHAGYVKRLEAIARAVAGEEARLIVRLCQLVKLFRAGEPVRMSKRAGDFVTLRELIDEVGPGVIRFIMLTRKNDAPLDFDFQKALEQSRENPVFYVQYAHARICSVFRNAEAELGSDAVRKEMLRAGELSALDDPAELTVVKRLAEYPRMIQGAALSHEPHRIAFYLYDLASDFHALWNRGKELPQLRFILPSEMNKTVARLALLHAIRYVLSSGLGIIGVTPIEEM